MVRFNIHEFSQYFGTENFINLANGFIAVEDMQNLNDNTAEGLLSFMKSEVTNENRMENMHNLRIETEIFTEAFSEGVKIGEYAFFFYDTDEVFKGFRPMSLMKAIV